MVQCFRYQLVWQEDSNCCCFLDVQVRLASGILKSGVLCLTLFKEKEEEKDMFSHYSSVFAVMEHRNLMDMFSLCMPHLFDCMLVNNQLLQIFSTLLSTHKVNLFVTLSAAFQSSSIYFANVVEWTMFMCRASVGIVCELLLKEIELM